MPEEIPISEVRRVVIEFEVRVPQGAPMRSEPATQPQRPSSLTSEQITQVRDEFIRMSRRNPDLGF